MFNPIQVTVRRPLLDLRTCCAISNENARSLVVAIEDRKLRYAFNLSAASGRREVRILAESLRDYMDGLVLPVHTDTPATLRATVANLFPALSTTVEAANFARVAGVCSTHVTNLIRARLLQVAVPPTNNASARLHRPSVVEFLISRRLP